MSVLNLVDELTNVSELRARLASCADARSEIIDFFHLLGVKLGFDSVKMPSASFRGVPLGTVALSWLDKDSSLAVAFEVELQREEKIAFSLCKLVDLSPKIAVVVVRSTLEQPNLLEKFRNYLFNSRLFQGLSQNFLLIDVSNGTFSFVEKKLPAPQHHGFERKKKIFGSRGEHKKQD